MNLKLKLGVLVLMVFTSIGCNSKPPLNQQEKSAIHVVSPAEFKEKLVGQVLVDIRTPQEFSQGYIEGSVNVNLFDANFLTEMAKFDKTKPIFLYCRSGNRTSSAAAKLAKEGFLEIYDLQGGISNWVNSNYQIHK